MKKFLLFFSSALFWMIPGRLSLIEGKLFFITPFDLIVVCLLFVSAFFLPINKKTTNRMKILVFSLIVLALVKSALGFFWVPEGLVAGYFPNTQWKGAPETSWHFKALEGKATRIDRKIDFYDKGFSVFQQTFPLYFANDLDRFNWGGDQAEKRKNFQFSAIWKGTLHVFPNDFQKIVLISKGGPAKIDINGTTASSNDGNHGYLNLKPGHHDIQIWYAHNEISPRQLTLGWVSDSGGITPIPSSRFSPGPMYPSGNPALKMVNYLLHIFWITLFILLVVNMQPQKSKWIIPKEKRIIMACILVFLILIFAHSIHKGYEPHAQILSGGNDWLSYETQARNILMGDILDVTSTGNNAFNINVFYRYFLALLHLIFGEGTTMVIIGQEIIMLFIVYFLYWMCRTLYNPRVGVFVFLLTVLAGRLIKFPKYLLDTTFNVGFSLLCLYFLIQYSRKNKIRHSVFSGFFLGIACGLRSNFVPFIFFAAIWIIWRTRDTLSKKTIAVAVFGILSIVPLLFIGARNYHVTGEFNIVPSTGAMNLWLGNRPAEKIGDNFFNPSIAMEHDEYISVLLNHIKSDPFQFIGGLAKKALFLLGIDQKNRVKWEVLIPNLLAIMGFYYFFRHYRRFSFSHEIFLLFLWVLMNWAILTVIFPWGYGWRLSGPTFPAVYIVGALFLDTMFRQKKIRKTERTVQSAT